MAKQPKKQANPKKTKKITQMDLALEELAISRANAECNVEQTQLAVEQSKIQAAQFNLNVRMNTGMDIANCSITIGGDIDEGFFELLDANLDQLVLQSPERILIKLQSNGGLCDEAYAALDRVRATPVPVDIDCYFAASAGTILLASATGKRRMARHGRIMVHESNVGIRARMTHVRDEVAELEREEAQYCEIMAEFTKKDADYWRSICQSGRDVWFNAKEALEVGLVDELF